MYKVIVIFLAIAMVIFGGNLIKCSSDIQKHTIIFNKMSQVIKLQQIKIETIERKMDNLK